MKKLVAALMLVVFCSCTSCSTSLGASSVATKVEVVNQASPPIPYLILSSEIDENVAQQAVAAFGEVEAMKADTVLLEINSPGGSVDAGFLIAKAIENSSAVVVCVVDAMAASMAFYILQSCDVRVMTSRSLLMAHAPSIGGRFSGKSEDWLREGHSIADLLEAMTKAMNHHMVHRMNISYEEFCNRIQGREWWMAAEEALAVGAVDRVVTSVREVQQMVGR